MITETSIKQSDGKTSRAVISTANNTKSKRATLLGEKRQDLMVMLREFALQQGLMRPDEELVLAIKNTTRTEYDSTALSVDDTTEWLKNLIDPVSGAGLGDVATMHIEFVLRNVDKPISWWLEAGKIKRYLVIKFVKGSLQQMLNAKAGIKARTTFCTWRARHKPDERGFQVFLGRVVEVHNIH